MDSMSRLKDQLPPQYAALADTQRVMGEALDTLTDLHDAAIAMGRALVDAGLPKRAWGSEQASLRLLSPALPAITMDTFLTRLEQLATGDGPSWLQGTHDDLARFHKGVAVLASVARPLRDVVDRLQHLPVDLPGGPRGDHALQGVVRHQPLQAPLDTIAEILSDLEALAPFTRPLTPEQWRAVRRARRGRWARIQRIIAAWAGSVQMRWRQGAQSSSGAASENARGAANARSFLGMGGAWTLQRLSALRRRRAQIWLAVVGLVVLIMGGLAVLSFARQPHTTSQTPSLSSSAVLTALAGSGTAASSATEAATLSPTPRATLALTPKLALTCVVHGATAALTLKNVSAIRLTWQAQTPPTLTVSPAQGTLQAEQSVNVQVSTVNKKTVSGTITVVATHDTQSTQDEVSCR
jgi:hypothetical protein